MALKQASFLLGGAIDRWGGGCNLCRYHRGWDIIKQVKHNCFARLSTHTGILLHLPDPFGHWNMWYSTGLWAFGNHHRELALIQTGYTNCHPALPSMLNKMPPCSMQGAVRGQWWQAGMWQDSCPHMEQRGTWLVAAVANPEVRNSTELLLQYVVLAENDKPSWCSSQVPIRGFEKSTDSVWAWCTKLGPDRILQTFLNPW